MIVQYFFSFDDGLDLNYDVHINRRFSIHADYSNAPEWTKLTNNQCKNCPLDKKVYSHCPAALDLDKVIQDLQKISALTKVNVRVLTAERAII